MKDKEQQVQDLNKKNEDLSKELKAAQGVTVTDGPVDSTKLKELESLLAESKAEQEKLSENVDAMKKKNNVSYHTFFYVAVVFYGLSQ